MKKMQVDTENEILRDLASQHLSKIESTADEKLFPGEYTEHTEPFPWSQPLTREARELIVAEEMLRFATITDRPVTSLSTQNSEKLFRLENVGKDVLHARTQEEPSVFNMNVYKNIQEDTIPQNNSSVVNREQVPNGFDCDVALDNGPHFEGNLDRTDVSREKVGARPECFEEDKFLGVEWTKVEKRRLRVVIRDFSRLMKTKKLEQKKARLRRQGRIIAQAIENKIYEYDREIMAVNRKLLSQVAFPLDQIEEYDWVKVATMLRTKRSPEACRTQWQSFLQPSFNSRD